MRAMKTIIGVTLLILAAATPTSAAVLSLSWVDNSANEDGFIIERGHEPSGPFVEVGRVGAGVQVYGDVTLSPGRTYCYQVRAFNAAGVSLPTNSACGVAAEPSLPVFGVNVRFDGPTMVVTVTLVPGTTPLLVDAYLVLQAPNGSLYSLIGLNTLAPGISSAATHVAPVPFSGEVFRYTFTGAEPRGPYAWFAALTVSGTLTSVGHVAEAAVIY